MLVRGVGVSGRGSGTALHRGCTGGCVGALALSISTPAPCPMYTRRPVPRLCHLGSQHRVHLWAGGLHGLCTAVVHPALHHLHQAPRGAGRRWGGGTSNAMCVARLSGGRAAAMCAWVGGRGGDGVWQARGGGFLRRVLARGKRLRQAHRKSHSDPGPDLGTRRLRCPFRRPLNPPSLPPSLCAQCVGRGPVQSTPELLGGGKFLVIPAEVK